MVPGIDQIVEELTGTVRQGIRISLLSFEILHAARVWSVVTVPVYWRPYARHQLPRALDPNYQLFWDRGKLDSTGFVVPAGVPNQANLISPQGIQDRTE